MKNKPKELKTCKIVNKKISPMNCAICECEGCDMAEKAKQNNAGVAS
jgi:hypothetical protein